ncbi:hypothetical protein TNCV_3958621 [Trichonephila clavipes]|nr:hypothetical protein TNCV_3958621 [Trichonephila clavipes]
MLNAVPMNLGLTPGGALTLCKCIVPLRHEGTLNSHCAVSPLMGLVEGEESWDAPDYPSVPYYYLTFPIKCPKQKTGFKLLSLGRKKKISELIQIAFYPSPPSPEALNLSIIYGTNELQISSNHPVKSESSCLEIGRKYWSLGIRDSRTESRKREAVHPTF